MAARSIPLTTGCYYHIYNRGTDRRQTFAHSRDYQEALLGLDYYRFIASPLRLSFFKRLNQEAQEILLDDLNRRSKRCVTILAYCLMPNHFHLLVRQESDGGISELMRKWINSYTRYFNTRHQRSGVLFQGQFKAVLVETDEQLIHVSRYIHINPVVSNVIRLDQLLGYQWSSLSEYLAHEAKGRRLLCNIDPVMNHFQTAKSYQNFLIDQVDYAKNLKKIEHLGLE